MNNTTYSPAHLSLMTLFTEVNWLGIDLFYSFTVTDTDKKEYYIH